MSEKQALYKTRKQTIFRTIKNEENPFVMIDRRPIENPALSWKAKGILTYLLSRPDNWIVRLGDLVKRSPDGVHAIRGAIKELMKAGHVSRKEVRENGRFLRYELEVYELPFTSTPLTNLSQAVKPQAENLTLNDNDSNDKQQPEEERPNVFAIYEQEIGILTPMIADALEDWEKSVPANYIPDAIREAVTNNARNWKYVEAILKRWKAQGHQGKQVKAQSKNGKPKQPNGFSVIQDWLEKTTGEVVNG